jgi:predicted nucleic acid-binding protein
MEMIKYKGMKKLRLYIDTSVLGGIFDTEEPKRVSIAERLLSLIKEGTYEGSISRLTIEEVIEAPEKIHGKLKAMIG